MIKYRDKKLYDGYVVNVYNLLNYDIDLILDDYKYKNVVFNEYTYQCDDIIYTSKSYRCRLNGILIHDKNNKKKKHMYTYEINKKIDKVDGWIQCYIAGVDVFNRLLIDIIIPHDINIKDYLMQDESMFQEYKKF